MGKKLLSNAQQRIVVRHLARFIPPQKIADLVKEEFKIEISRQAVECYDPTKVAGAELKEDLRALFLQEREAYIAAVNAVGIANKVYRLEALDRLAASAEVNNNYRWAAHFHKQAKEEVEGVQSGKPDPAGKNNPKASPSLKVTIESGTGTSSQSASETGYSVSE